MLVVAALTFISLDHGLPERYVPDDTVVRCALGIARDASEGGGLAALVPPAARYTTYPYLLPYLDLGALGVTYVAGRVTGAWAGAGNFAEAIFENPGIAWLPGRMVSALLAMLLPLGVYRACRELRRSKGEAALAALLGGSSLMVVQFAHTTRPWAPMLGFAALALALSLRLQRRRRMRDVAAAFAVAAMAGASFQVGLVFLGLPVVGLLLPLRELSLAPGEASGGPGAAPVSGRLKLLAQGLLAAVLVLGVGYPYKLVHGADSGQGHQTGQSALLEGGAESASTVDIGGQAFGLTLFGGARFDEIARSWLGYDPVLALAGLIGLLLLMRGPGSASARWLLVILPGAGLTAAFLLYDGSHVRYMMAGTPFLAVAAGATLAHMVRGPRPLQGLALLALALPIVQAARLDLLLGRTDTRSLAAVELLEHIGLDDIAAVDGLGSQYGPPLVSRADTLRAMMADQEARATGPEQAGGIWLNRREQRILALDEAGQPAPDEARQLLPIQRYWKYISYYPTDFLFGDEPVELSRWMADWGVDVYVRVDRSPRTEPRAPIDEFTAAHGRLVYERSPTGQAGPEEAALPTDMSFALTQLWTYERPGPWIRAWRLTP